MAKKKINKIAKFIEDNKLDFSGSGSDLNSNFCIISGYACHLKLDLEEVIAFLEETKCTYPFIDREELEKVFEYAQKHDYGKYWKTEAAKKTYVF